MKKRFFENIRTRQELRKAYLKLLKQYHPDNGGDPETCKALNSEYERLFQTLPETADPNQEATEEQKKAAADMDQLIRETLEKIIRFEGLNIEIVGTWIWVDGNTYIYKDQLKDAGFTWSKARKKWHAAPYGERIFYRNRKGQKKPAFDDIRRRYGSEFVQTEKTEKVAG